MVVELEKNRAELKIREMSLLDNNFQPSQILDLKNFEKVELGYRYMNNPSAPAGVRAVLVVQFSIDGVTFYDMMSPFDKTPGGSNPTHRRTVLLANELEIFGITGTGNAEMKIWHPIMTSARFLNVLAREEGNGGLIGSLEIVARVSDI